MSTTCNWGEEIALPSQRLGCLGCGVACCPACAFTLESAMYCQSCARRLLETVTVRPGDAADLI